MRVVIEIYVLQNKAKTLINFPRRTHPDGYINNICVLSDTIFGILLRQCLVQKQPSVNLWVTAMLWVLNKFCVGKYKYASNVIDSQTKRKCAIHRTLTWLEGRMESQRIIKFSADPFIREILAIDSCVTVPSAVFFRSGKNGFPINFLFRETISHFLQRLSIKMIYFHSTLNIRRLMLTLMFLILANFIGKPILCQDSLSAEIDNEAEGTTKSTTIALEDLKIGVITRKPLLRARQFASGLVKILDGDTFEKDVGKQRNDIEDDVTLNMKFESWTTETTTPVATSDSQATLEQSIIPTNEPFTTENQLACSNSTSGSEKGNQWLEWSAWTACTDECGACGTHSRSRLCLTNHPGCVCIGPSLEIEKCNRNFCSYPRNTCCAGLRAKSVNGTFMCIELTKISELV